MAYLLVMGGLALSVFFTLGWGLVSVVRWLGRRLTGACRQSPRQQARRASNRPKASSRASPKHQTASRSSPDNKTSSKATTAKVSSKPWGVTRWLARQHSLLPLGLLVLLLYGGSRLAEYGMAFRPHEAPGAYHSLVSSLGWVSAVLLALAVVNLLAVWRCRR